MLERPIRYLILLIAASGLLFSLERAGAFSAGIGFINRALVSPVVGVASGAFEKIISTAEPVLSFRSFLGNFRALENERNYYRGEYFRLQGIEEENGFLRGALELENNPAIDLVLAEVITFDPLRPNQFLIINRGRDEGLAAGDPVILAGRILIGRIEETTAKTSRVLLITSEASRLVTRLERSGTSAALSGSPSGALLLDLVLPETGLEEGEIITSSGLDSDIPPDLLIGQVSKVLSQETASFKKAVVRPFFNARDLRQVFVIK